MVSAVTTVKIDFATSEEAKMFNANLDSSLAQVREAVGCPTATVIAPGGAGDGLNNMRKLKAAVWHVVQLPQAEHCPNAD